MKDTLVSMFWIAIILALIVGVIWLGVFLYGFNMILFAIYILIISSLLGVPTFIFVGN